ncbi:GH25 family lysozyme [uncultured Phenylobacterium sp.]|uniref:GH25 family lysozyme n=1 Tax=uncultured Phenylobacterium sp. TaxID=349273 RepID=UPI0025FF749E|nr:GH25 family lysozyme [uncultured Phenylobacterium sp.]
MAGAPRRLIPWFAAVLAAVTAIAVVVPWPHRSGPAGPAEPDPRQYPVRGIDVSHHNAHIDWKRVHAAKIRFAYLKASEGGDRRDPAFGANARGAARVGLPVGAYHYFTLCRPGADQAANFLAATATARLRLRPAIDLEFAGNCATRPPRKAFNRELAVFINALRQGGAREPIFYVTPEFHAAYLAGGPFQRRTYWVRDLVGRLDKPAHSRVLFWQFAARGRVDGVEGPVDLNAFVGDEGAFRATLAP